MAESYMEPLALGQGKSTLVNDLLHELGDASRPAKEDFLKPCTRGVQVYKRCPGYVEWVFFKLQRPVRPVPGIQIQGAFGLHIKIG